MNFRTFLCWLVLIKPVLDIAAISKRYVRLLNNYSEMTWKEMHGRYKLKNKYNKLHYSILRWYN